jgi:Caspase domain
LIINELRSSADKSAATVFTKKIKNSMKINCSILLVFILFLSVKSIAQSPELRVPATHEGSKFTFSKDDKIMISLGQNELKVWDTEGPYLLKSVPMPGSDTSYNVHLYLTTNNKKVVVNLNGRIKILDTKTFEWDKTTWKIPEPRMEGISADGKTLYYFTLSDKGVATLFKLALETGKSTKLFTFSPEDAMAFGGDLCLNSDETFLISSSDLGGVMVDLKTAKIIHKFNAPQWGLFFNEAGNLITSTQITTGNSDKDTYGGNRKFKVEEIEPRSMKVLRSMTVTTKSDDIPDYNGIYWVSHNNRDKILYEVNSHFYTVNTNTFTQSKRQQVHFNIESFTSNMAILSDGGKFVFWSGYMTAFKTDDVKKPYQFGIAPYQPFMLSDVSKGDELKVIAGNKLISFEPRGLTFNQLPKAQYFDFHSSFRYLPSQKRLFMEGVEFETGKNQGAVYVYDLKNDTSQFSKIELSKELSYDVVSMREYDELNTIVMLSQDRFFIVDTRTLKVKQQVLYGEGMYLGINTGQKDDEHYCALSLDKTKIVIFLTKENRQDDNNLIVCYDLINKKAVWKYDGNSMTSNPIYTDGGKSVQFFDDKKNLIVLDALSGKVKSTNNSIPKADYTSFFSPTQKYVLNKTFDDIDLYGGISKFEVYDVASKKFVLSLPKPNVAYKNVIFMANDRYLLTQDEDMKLWDLKTGKLAARIITFQNSNDWIMLTPDGRFDGSQGGLKQIYYVKGQEVIPLEQLSEGFYTPNLMKQVLAGVESDTKKDIKNIKSPPSVKLTYEPSKKLKELMLDDMVMEVTVDKANIQVTADASCIDGTIEEIRLYHNGKLVGNSTRNLVVEDEKSKTEKKIFDIELVEGENRLKVVAINNQRTESKPDEILFTYKPKSPSTNSGSVNNITLHMIVIGINKYKNQKYNLNYATADATSFKETIESGGKGLYNKTNIVFIGDEKATKEGIVSELEKIKLLASPKDVFIFYYAGHGVVNQNKEFYLVPNDVTQLYGADDALAQKGLSANQLQQFSKEIKAQKQLFILDACQSAGALDQVMASRGAAEEKAIAQLARATGTHWLTASGSEQFASEFQQLGHGTFTYVLLEALSGKADKGGDKKITVKELDAYLQEVVPEMTAKYKGTPQYPASYGFGNDFPIGVVRN